MTSYAPVLEEFVLGDLQSSSDTDSQYQVVNYELVPREYLLHFNTSRKALGIKVQKAPLGYWTATSDEFALYGDGETEKAALLDYIEMLLEYHDELEKEEDILGPFLQKELLNLRKYLN